MRFAAILGWLCLAGRLLSLGQSPAFREKAQLQPQPSDVYVAKGSLLRPTGAGTPAGADVESPANYLSVGDPVTDYDPAQGYLARLRNYPDFKADCQQFAAELKKL